MYATTVENHLRAWTHLTGISEYKTDADLLCLQLLP